MLTIDQIIIALTGCSASWMIHSTSQRTRKTACILAVIGQPAWFYAAWKAQQLGILLMDFIYTASWIRGLFYNWR